MTKLYLVNDASVFPRRSSHLATGDAFIVVANFVSWLTEVQMKKMAMMTLLHLLYLRADYAIKNVFSFYFHLC